MKITPLSDSTATIDVFAFSPSGHDLTEIGYNGVRTDAYKNINANGGTYSFNIEELMPGSTYQLSPYARASDGSVFTGDQILFEMPHFDTVSVSASISELAFESVDINVDYAITNSGSKVTEVGILSNQFSIIPQTGIYQSSGQSLFSLNNLAENTTYYYVPYVVANNIYCFGDTLSFATMSYQDDVLVTSVVSDISFESADVTIEYNVVNAVSIVTDLGLSSTGFSVSQTGFNTASGQYTFTISGLAANTTYSFVPYVITNGVQCFGDSSGFTTVDGFSTGPGPAGGYIFYDDGNGGGMEVAIHYIQADWGCSGQSIPGTSLLLGSGQANTDSIITHCTSTATLAYLCSEFSYGGYDDWYMPSRDELIKVYEIVYSQVPGLINSDAYLSSTEYSGDHAWLVGFDAANYYTFATNKATFYTLPVRSF
jgi:hypothetical protein